MTTAQFPIGSPFGAASTAQDILKGVNLSGKTAIVTGGYSGIGLEAARVLASAGVKVVVPARNIEKAKQTLADHPEILIEPMDLMDPTSVDAFAERFLAANKKLDILINNAGSMASPLARDARGNESQFSTNVLGHFQLTCRLWSALVAARGARVIALSSANHRIKVADFLHDPNFEHGEYDSWKAYANTKAANVLFAVALDSIGQRHGVRAFSVHPGGIFDTGLLRHTDVSLAIAAGMADKDGNAIIDPEKGWKTREQGAATMVWAATSTLLEGKGGVYCSDCEVGTQLAEDEGPLSTTGVTPGVKDSVNSGRLWQLCEQLTGARLD
ncbi:SDR family NAD(P)-dependent oxidoreductase [Stigmatella sp. ncwal1]|uniref:SDR family NAD(P)-dependent oxidoreductase n=1 Tax=Stigmatella ashevillensis TaxID=2995309 RepID=A0ABT5DKN1_9BACT|nr:SDR family NAD(P)-dependent oxidoreductase [Stigmatella ashevillena]MDC0714173.1 SDR family NAD(P)-dependent oxidoreductase [Stigmatella ashevillena]